MSGASERSAAFLAEMGLGPLWTVRAAVPADAGGEGVAQAGAGAPPAARAAAPVSAPAPASASPPGADSAWGEEAPAAPATDEEIARMDWAGLRAAIAACTRCGLCKGGRQPVYGSGAQAARWLVAAGASTAADEKARMPLAGDPGVLLGNMLAAAGLTRETDAYVTNLIKCRPASASGAERAPTQAEADACRPYLERELALTRASVVLTLGQIAANALLGKPLQEPLAGKRGVLHELNGVALAATLHPGELLRRGADKALAWADLCLAASAEKAEKAGQPAAAPAADEAANAPDAGPG